MKVLDRGTIHEAPELPELPADVKIPDDLRGLERADRSRLSTTVRWLRWLPLVLLVAVGAILVTGDFGGDTVDTTVPWTVDEGPGSSSLDGAVATQSVVPTPARGPFTSGEGPGTHSLNVPSSGPWASNDGPGSNSLGSSTPSDSGVPWSAGDGPGSNSLGS